MKSKAEYTFEKTALNRVTKEVLKRTSDFKSPTNVLADLLYKKNRPFFGPQKIDSSNYKPGKVQQESEILSKIQGNQKPSTSADQSIHTKINSMGELKRSGKILSGPGEGNDINHTLETLAKKIKKSVNDRRTAIPAPKGGKGDLIPKIDDTKHRTLLNKLRHPTVSDGLKWSRSSHLPNSKVTKKQLYNYVDTYTDQRLGGVENLAAKHFRNSNYTPIGNFGNKLAPRIKNFRASETTAKRAFKAKKPTLENLSKVDKLLNRHPDIEPNAKEVKKYFEKIKGGDEALQGLEQVITHNINLKSLVGGKYENSQHFKNTLEKAVEKATKQEGLVKFKKDFPGYADRAMEKSVEVAPNVKKVRGAELSSISGSKCFGNVCISNPSHGKSVTSDKTSYVESALKGESNIYTYKPGDRKNNALILTDSKNKVLEMSGPDNASVGRNDLSDREDLQKIIKTLGLEIDKKTRIL